MSPPAFLDLCITVLALAAIPARVHGEPKVQPPPEPAARVEHPDIREGSGLTESRARPGAFWVINDGGHDPVLFLMDAEGRHLARVEVEGARNRDWEALAADARGNLWIGDVGNNQNRRRDLTVYRVPDPAAKDPIPESVKVERAIRVRYPDQQEFPPVKNNFDCEGIFAHQGALYFLTKHRADRDTKLYRLDLDKEEEGERELELVGRARDVGQVTGADLHSDGRRLAVLTFSGAWMFERPEGSDHFLAGTPTVYRLQSWAVRQTEGVAWLDDDALLVTNEQREIYRFPVERFEKVDGETDRLCTE